MGWKRNLLAPRLSKLAVWDNPRTAFFICSSLALLAALLYTALRDYLLRQPRSIDVSVMTQHLQTIESLFFLAEMDGAPVLDLHGMRVHEAVTTLDQFLNHELIAGSEIVTIVHGYGTGALKQAVHDHLKTIPFVDQFRLSDKTGGMTHVVLTP